MEAGVRELKAKLSEYLGHVAAGEQVVVVGQTGLRDGAAIRVVNGAPNQPGQGQGGQGQGQGGQGQGQRGQGQNTQQGGGQPATKTGN
jgi:hypothetical protein